MTDPAATPAQVSPESFKQRFFATLQDVLKDVSELTVTTYVTYGDGTGTAKIKIDGYEYDAVLQAHTKIDWDADTVALLPARKDNQEILVRKELYDVHQEHVQLARQTRQEMLNTLLSAIKSVADLK